MAISPLCNRPSELGRPYRVVRSFRPLLFQTVEHIIASPSIGDVIPYSTVLHFLFAKAPAELRSPHQVRFINFLMLQTVAALGIWWFSWFMVIIIEELYRVELYWYLLYYYFIFSTIILCCKHQKGRGPFSVTSVFQSAIWCIPGWLLAFLVPYPVKSEDYRI